MATSRWTRWLRRRSNEDFAAEVEAHLEMEVDRLVQAGMDPNEARFAARRAFGNPTVRREDFHESRTAAGIESLGQDVRYGLRTMRRSPAFTAIAIASLAIGIGANTTMFGTIDALLLRPPAHVRDADRLHRIAFELPNSRGATNTFVTESFRTFMALREQVPSFETLGAFSSKTVSSGRGADARSLEAVIGTSSFFEMLGVRPRIGRFFLESEDRPEGDRVAVLGYDLWHGRYGSDVSVLGQSIDVAGTPYLIVGVAPEGFTGVDVDRVDLWLPFSAAEQLVGPGVSNPRATNFWLTMIGKRRSSVPVDRAADETTTAYRDSWRGSPRYEETFGKARVILGPIAAPRGPGASAEARVAIWIAAVSLLVLLIASANVANLLLLRGLTRSREVALRLSLGATRWRLVRQWLVEGTLLAIAGAVCAMVLAFWSSAAMRTFLLPRAEDVPILNARLLVFTAVVALGGGLLTSLIPAVAMARRDFGPLLGTGRVVGGPQRLALQRVLIGAQVALATVLVVGAGLFVTSLRNVRAIDLGVDVNHVVYMNVDLGPASARRGGTARTATNATYRTMLDAVRRVPGVASATMSETGPLGGGTAVALRRPGGPELTRRSPVPFKRAVGTQYFETMGTSLIRGRLFTEADHVADAHVAIVDEATARVHGLARDGLDPCLYLGSDDRCTEVVGVVENSLQWRVTEDKLAIIYLPLEADPFTPLVTMIEVRTTNDPHASVPALRQAVLSTSPNLPWVDIRLLSDHLAPQLRPWRIGASMFTAFGVLALSLTAIGLYGLLSFVVTQRHHEIGVRKALGASDSGVVRIVMRSALGMTAGGVALGVIIALGSGGLVASQLYGVSPRDPFLFAACVSVLGAVAVVACLAPALRAARVDPMVTLRSD